MALSSQTIEVCNRFVSQKVTTPAPRHQYEESVFDYRITPARLVEATIGWYSFDSLLIKCKTYGDMYHMLITGPGTAESN